VCHVQQLDNGSYVTEQDGQYTCNVTVRRVLPTIVAAEIAIRITYCECVFVALGIQHAVRMCCVVILLYSIFLHYPMNGTIFKKKKKKKILLNTKCVFWFSLRHLSEIFLILGQIDRDMDTNVQYSLCKVPVIAVRR
jgi:hypothetical protein